MSYPTTFLRECNATFEPVGTCRTAPAGHNTSVAKASAIAPSESQAARRARRLERFIELGGAIRAAGNAWHQCGKRGVLAALEREEQGAGRAMCHRNDIRADLVAALLGRSMVG